MFEPQIKNYFFKIAVVSLLFYALNFIVSSLDTHTKIVFCDVGQGDAAYIRIANRVDVLIDAGPDRTVLSCLSRHMPFYDRTIELAFISHPQKDHFGGFIYLLERYFVKLLVFSPVRTKKASYQKLLDSIKSKKIAVKPHFAGDYIDILGGKLEFYWPTEDYLKSFNSQIDDPNEISQILVFRQGSSAVLFTGDITYQILGRLLEQSIPTVDILKVPHHGSKTGLNPKILGLADPQVSVISVGKRNKYGHPSPKILDILKAAKTKIRRTDIEGDIIFKIPN